MWGPEAGFFLVLGGGGQTPAHCPFPRANTRTGVSLSPTATVSTEAETSPVSGPARFQQVPQWSEH